MRELVINAWCDPCGQDGVRTPAGSFTVTLGLAESVVGPLEVELCDVHAKELVAPLADLLTDLGRTPHDLGAAKPAGGAKKSAQLSGQGALPGTMTATMFGSPGGKYPCPECGRVLGTYQSLGTHTRRIHRCGAATYYGDWCPLCGLEFARLAQHTNRAHASPDIVQAFLLAKHQGDTHGIVKRLERDWASAARASKAQD